MKREEFEDRVESQAPPDLRGSDHLMAAIYRFGRQGGPFYHSDVREVIEQAAARLEQAALPEQTAPPRRSPRPQPGAEAHFLSRVLMEAFEPWAEGLREQGFGSTAPPYLDDLGAAADYIEAASAADLARWREVDETFWEDHEQLRRSAGRQGLDVKPKRRELPYARLDDGYRKAAVAAPGTFLFKLAGEIDRVSQKTGLPPDSLTGYVLTGGLPLMPRVWRTNHEKYFRLPSGEQAHLRSVTLTFRTADLTFEELRTLYGSVKDYMGGSGAQAPDFEDYELWKMVREMGGPPEPYDGVRVFWRAVLEAWNCGHPDDPPLKSWEGLQKRYRRVCKRLGIQ
jgi:hypothetical protein